MGSNGKASQRKYDSRRSWQYRTYGGGRPLINPWENGVIPGTESSYNQHVLAQQTANAYLMNSLMNRGQASNLSENDAQLLRLYELMEGLDGQGNRSVLPSSRNNFESLLGPPPIPPLFDHSTSSLSAAARIDLLQRMGPNAFTYPWGSNYPTMFSDSSSRRIRNTSKSKQPAKAKSNSEARQKQTKSPIKSSKSAEPNTDCSSKERALAENNQNSAKDKGKEVPSEILFCNICSRGCFQSEKSYLDHLKESAHLSMAIVFHEKLKALKEYLRLCCKLGQMRREDRSEQDFEKSSCKKNNYRTAEERVFQTFNKRIKCCDRRFNNRSMFEEHKLTISHIKTMHGMNKMKGGKKKDKLVLLMEEGNEENNEDPEDEEEQNEPTEEVEAKDQFEKRQTKVKRCDTDPSELVIRLSLMLKEARQKVKEETIMKLSPYDPSKLCGLEFITENIYYVCAVCKPKTPFSRLDFHCHSDTHYESVLNHFNRVQEAKAAEEVSLMKKEEAVEKKEEEKKDQSDESIKQEIETVLENNVEEEEKKTKDETRVKMSDSLPALESPEGATSLTKEDKTVETSEHLEPTGSAHVCDDEDEEEDSDCSSDDGSYETDDEDENTE